MGFLESFLPRDDRRAALLLYGLVISSSFSGYDAGVMSVILPDEQFIEYYHVDEDRTGLISTIPWLTQGLAQLCIAGILSSKWGRLWTIRASM